MYAFGHTVLSVVKVRFGTASWFSMPRGTTKDLPGPFPEGAGAASVPAQFVQATPVLAETAGRFMPQTQVKLC